MFQSKWSLIMTAQIVDTSIECKFQVGQELSRDIFQKQVYK